MRKEIGSSQGRTKATILIVIIYPVHFYTSGLFPLIMSLWIPQIMQHVEQVCYYSFQIYFLLVDKEGKITPLYLVIRIW